ncbi:hypothetical protein [Polyangium jinanense]|uniref:PEGA domain-containing protein n=1 Tax=Polyangium jinanense TaxID=2829994 RepID=A0A9X3WWD7_9BACT|nr:hypothetical protein [Polyangium jinanense]MDC3953457.1 hypothetical protein [Polyangium jinanense]MDC3979422.1 hypothetical protein [Polyangium jinanense]
MRVTIDGKPKNRMGRSSFWIFMRSGDHELRATLDGYEEAIVPFTVKKREDKQLPVTLKPLPVPAPPVPAVYEPEKDPPKVERVVVGGDANLPKQEDPWGYEDPRPAQKSEEKRWSIGGGPVVVFGVASWMPAVGLVAGGSWRASEYVSLGLEGRAAWLTTGVGGRQIAAMTAGGLLSACGHWRWLFGCALGHLGVMKGDFSAQSYQAASFVDVYPGAGGRVGAQLRVSPSFRVDAATDVLGLTKGTKIAVGQTVIVDQPPVMLSVSLGVGWEF